MDASESAQEIDECLGIFSPRFDVDSDSVSACNASVRGPGSWRVEGGTVREFLESDRSAVNVRRLAFAGDLEMAPEVGVGYARVGEGVEECEGGGSEGRFGEECENVVQQLWREALEGGVIQ